MRQTGAPAPIVQGPPKFACQLPRWQRACGYQRTHLSVGWACPGGVSGERWAVDRWNEADNCFGWTGKLYIYRWWWYSKAQDRGPRARPSFPPTTTMAKSTPTAADIASQLNEPELVEDTLEDEAETEESPEETIPYAESDVPQFIESLYSKNEEDYQKVRWHLCVYYPKVTFRPTGHRSPNLNRNKPTRASHTSDTHSSPVSLCLHPQNR